MGSSARKVVLWTVILLGWLPAMACAADIAQRLPSGLTAHADYRPGQPGKPAVLVLHGFMTTQNFNLIRNISAELHELGYTVLAPTLTLDIDERRGGLACSAIHTHTMENDLAELDWWARWLHARHPGPMALVGHSSGSLQILAYVATEPKLPVATIIVTSPIYFGQDYDQRLVQEQTERAQQMLAQASPGLGRFALTFCNQNYVATPQSYLSYAAWDRARVLTALSAIKVPVRAIFGGADPRATTAWKTGLQEAGAQVVSLGEASHFFDGIHEFELFDFISGALQQVTPAKSSSKGAS